jgi:predicted metal-binding membrane protein
MNTRATVPSTRAAESAVAFAATLGVAAAAWVISIRQMAGMNMGTATRLGSFGFFVALWAAMMAAMMLPGAVPVVLRMSHATSARAVPSFVASYLAVWTLVGVVIYLVYRPHGALAAGVVAIAAGIYELTPLKQRCRRQCQERRASGFDFGMCCIGSSIGLMLVFVAVSVMSVAWMCVFAVPVIAQKLLRASPAIDALVALAVVGLGLLLVFAPSSVPDLARPMPM